MTHIIRGIVVGLLIYIALTGVAIESQVSQIADDIAQHIAGALND